MELKVEGLTCQRGERLLFEGLSFVCPAGGAVQLEGPNGSGKSSLLRLIAGLLRPGAGSISAPALAYLGHEVALKPRMSLADELRHWAALDSGLERLPAAVRAMQLDALLDVPCRHLSSGQRRRAGLARVIASGAALWLLDEPTAGLDTASSARLAEAMAAHRAGGGLVVAAVHGDIGLRSPVMVRLG